MAGDKDTIAGVATEKVVQAKTNPGKQNVQNQLKKEKKGRHRPKPVVEPAVKESTIAEKKEKEKGDLKGQVDEEMKKRKEAEKKTKADTKKATKAD